MDDINFVEQSQKMQFITQLEKQKYIYLQGVMINLFGSFLRKGKRFHYRLANFSKQNALVYNKES